jgi:hypothetical protein
LIPLPWSRHGSGIIAARRRATVFDYLGAHELPEKLEESHPDSAR